MKRLVTGLMALFLLLAPVSCSRPPEKVLAPLPSTASSEGAPAPAPAPPRTVPAPMIVPTPAATPSGTAQSSQTGVTERMVVRSGQMSLVVQDIPAAIDQIAKLADKFKGYVVSSRSWREGNRLRGSISIRIPAGDFDNVMKSLAELAVEVTSQSTSSKDEYGISPQAINGTISGAGKLSFAIGPSWRINLDATVTGDRLEGVYFATGTGQFGSSGTWQGTRL